MPEFYQNTDKTTDVWLTPPDLINKLGEFDLDPCCTNNLKWKTAKNYYSLENGQNGLELPWADRIWLNPPYSDWSPFLKKLSEHNNGIALIQTSKSAWFNLIWNNASGCLMMPSNLKFVKSNGESAPVFMPTMLFSFGESNREILVQSELGRVR